MKIDNQLLNILFYQVKASSWLCQSFALCPHQFCGQKLANVQCLAVGDKSSHSYASQLFRECHRLCGRIEEVFYNEDGTQEVERIHMCPAEGYRFCWRMAYCRGYRTILHLRRQGWKYGEDGSLTLKNN